jgi:hypothetical protein
MMVIYLWGPWHWYGYVEDSSTILCRLVMGPPKSGGERSQLLSSCILISSGEQ